MRETQWGSPTPTMRGQASETGSFDPVGCSVSKATERSQVGGHTLFEGAAIFGHLTRCPRTRWMKCVDDSCTYTCLFYRSGVFIPSGGEDALVKAHADVCAPIPSTFLFHTVTQSELSLWCLPQVRPCIRNEHVPTAAENCTRREDSSGMCLEVRGQATVKAPDLKQPVSFGRRWAAGGV